MRIALWCILGQAGLLVAACGGTDSNLLGNNPDGNGNADGGGTDSAVGAVDAGGGDGGRGERDSGTARDAGGSTDSGAGSCPDVTGSYSIAKSGPGCGDLANDAPQCIVASGTTCTDSFVSAKPDDAGLARGINGDADLGSDGSFIGASLTEGTIDRSGCTGSWDAASSTMTVTCGGLSTLQSCVVTLTRTGSSCN